MCKNCQSISKSSPIIETHEKTKIRIYNRASSIIIITVSSYDFSRDGRLSVKTSLALLNIFQRDVAALAHRAEDAIFSSVKLSGSVKFLCDRSVI